MVNKKYDVHFPKWMKVLELIDAEEVDSIHRLSRVSDTTYAWLYSIITVLKKHGVCVIEKKGRCQQPSLTAKGKKMRNHLLFLKGGFR